MEAIFGIPFDVLVAVGVLTVFLVFNYTIGRYRSATMLLSLYIAGAVIMLAPVMDVLPELLPVPAVWVPVLEVVGITGLVYVILTRCLYFDPYMVPAGWELGVFAVLQAVVAVAMVVSLEPAAVTTAFSPNFARVFLDPMARSAFLVGPLLVFVVFRGRE